MEDFASIKKTIQLDVDNHLVTEAWTMYHVPEHPFGRCPNDWGMSLLYHFDQEWSPALIPVWLGIMDRIREEVECVPSLSDFIDFVPFYSVGRDYVLQCKPPLDGGYSTRMYEEFLDCGSCMPNEWILRDIHRLHQGYLDWYAKSASDPRSELMETILHSTLVQPNHVLFWGDGRWILFQPNLDHDQVKAWQESSAKRPGTL
jgi:hypothetical protein